MKDLSIELQTLAKQNTTAILQPFKDVTCMTLDQLDSCYAFDPGCEIECDTEKEKNLFKNKS